MTPVLNTQSILIPTDFSANARRAVELGIEMARGTNARVHLFHVIETSVFGPTYIPQGGVILPESPDDVYKQLDALKAEVTAKVPEAEVVTAAAMGNPADEIVAHAEAEHVDLICISTHGRRGLKRQVLGSTTEAVVRRARCPVLSVHGATETQDGEAKG
ncbi:MAG: universal stress protein [Proteobacteria bacterium]|nr:universal stress protein [Pseudomonadota bacterium]